MDSRGDLPQPRPSFVVYFGSHRAQPCQEKLSTGPIQRPCPRICQNMSRNSRSHSLIRLWTRRPAMPCSSFAERHPTSLPVCHPDSLLNLSWKILASLTRIKAMIFLQDNTLLERDLIFNDIKPRLLGVYTLLRHKFKHSDCILMPLSHRSLGNMPRSRSRLFPPQLSHPNSRP